MSENLRNVLSALLYQTGTQSEHYMLVLATNRPEDLDRAITDRIDEALHFDLPRLEVRCCTRRPPTLHAAALTLPCFLVHPSLAFSPTPPSLSRLPPTSASPLMCSCDTTSSRSRALSRSHAVDVMLFSQERERMLRQYFQQYILDRAGGLLVAGSRGKGVSGGAGLGLGPGIGSSLQSGGGGRWPWSRPGATPISVHPDLVQPEALRTVAAQTDTFSGRELSKLVLKMQVRGVPCVGQPFGCGAMCPHSVHVVSRGRLCAGSCVRHRRPRTYDGALPLCSRCRDREASQAER